jgi:hypothetical protein
VWCIKLISWISSRQPLQPFNLCQTRLISARVLSSQAFPTWANSGLLSRALRLWRCISSALPGPSAPEATRRLKIPSQQSNQREQKKRAHSRSLHMPIMPYFCELGPVCGICGSRLNGLVDHRQRHVTATIPGMIPCRRPAASTSAKMPERQSTTVPKTSNTRALIGGCILI